MAVTSQVGMPYPSETSLEICQRVDMTLANKTRSNSTVELAVTLLLTKRRIGILAKIESRHF